MVFPLQAFLEFGSEECAQTMVSYYSSVTPVIRNHPIYMQYSTHKELKTDNSPNQVVSVTLLLPVVDRISSCSFITKRAFLCLLQKTFLTYFYKTCTLYHQGTVASSKKCNQRKGLYKKYIIQTCCIVCKMICSL